MNRSQARPVGNAPGREVREPAQPARRRRPVAARVGTGAALAVLGALLVPVGAAHASLADVGPVSAVNGYPTYFEDSTGLRVRLCDDPAQGCTMPEVPRPADPVSFPGNYAGENFYFAAATADASYEAAVEAAFTGEDAVAGEQILFNRIRIRLTGLVIGETYQITHPYGTLSLVAENNGEGSGEINYTDDQGCMAPPCGDYSTVLPQFVGDQARQTSMNFLTRVGFDPATAQEGDPIGDPLTPTPVTGSVFDTNYFEVLGPDAGGAGVDRLFQDTFTIEGQVAAPPDPNRPSTPDLAETSDTGAHDQDNITSATTPTFTGTAPSGSTVELLVDGDVAGTGTATDGAYSIAPTAALTNGSPRIQARVANPLHDPDPLSPGHGAPATLTSGSLNIKVDTIAAAATIGFPRPTNNTADVTPTFTFGSAEPGSVFECSLAPAPETLERVYEPCVSPLTYDDQQRGSYVFAVRALDPAGNVGAAATHSWTIGTTLRAPSVTGIDFVNGLDRAVEVHWFPPLDDGGSAVTGYRVQAFRGATALPVRAVAASQTSYTYTGLTNGVDYTVKVWAVNAVGAGPASTSDVVRPFAPQGPPAAPAIGTATPLVRSANVTWNTPADGGSPITGYEVQVHNGSTGALVGAPRPAAANATSLVVTGLTAGSLYDFKVRAVNALGKSEYSGFSNAVTPTGTVNAAPRVTARTPGVDAVNVGQAVTVTATFSEAVRGVSTTSFVLVDPSGRTVPAAVRNATGTNRWILDPTANLAARTRYTVSLSSAITDTQGAPLAGTTWSFTTGGTANAAPVLSARTPAAGATGVAVGSNVTVTFNEAVTGVSGTTFTLKAPNGTTVAAAVTRVTGTNRYVLNPTANLARNTVYTVTVTGGPTAIRDTAGAAFVTQTWTFRTVV